MMKATIEAIRNHGRDVKGVIGRLGVSSWVRPGFDALKSIDRFRKRKNHDLPEGPTGLTNRLSEIALSLQKASQDAEPKFIQLGNDLQSVFSGATGLSHRIFETVKAFGEGSKESFLVKVRERVEMSFQELGKRDRELSKNLTNINRIVESLGNLHKKCASFEQTAMVIRAVGLNLAVESTRSAESREMFTVVSEEIRKVSEKIAGINKNIIDDSKKEHHRQISVHREISEGMDHLSQLEEEGKTAIQRAVREIERLIGLSTKAMDDAGHRSRDISQRVGELVQGVQFHDNMSQRVEHIISAFHDVEKLCKGEDDKNGLGHKEAALRDTYEIIRLQEAQLEMVISEVVSVHQRSLKAFEKIKKGVGKLAETLSSFDSGEKKGDPEGGHSYDDPISSLIAALAQLLLIHKKGFKLIERIKGTAAHASRTAASLTDNTKLVRSISLETHIMALNAIVKAAHLGDQGRTHEVLAQEMRNLSKLSGLFVEDVEKIIGPVIASAQDMKIGADQREDGEEGSDESDAPLDWGVVDTTNAYVDFLRVSIDIVHQADALKPSIARASEGLDFLNILAEKLSTGLTELEKTREMLSPRAEKVNGNSSANRNGLTDRYTMHQERVVHNEVVGETDELLELFEDDPERLQSLEAEAALQPTQGTSEVAVQAGEDLGDNIELF